MSVKNKIIKPKWLISLQNNESFVRIRFQLLNETILIRLYLSYGQTSYYYKKKK